MSRRSARLPLGEITGVIRLGGAAGAIGLFALAFSACTAPPPPPDMSRCEGAVCDQGCYLDGDCAQVPGRPHCDPARNVCVACLADGDCGAGEVCSPIAKQCVHGCGGGRTCGPDGGVCE